MDNCPICGLPMKHQTYHEANHLSERYDRCEYEHYFYDYHYGHTVIVIGPHEKHVNRTVNKDIFSWNYSTDSSKKAQTQQCLREAIERYKQDHAEELMELLL